MSPDIKYELHHVSNNCEILFFLENVISKFKSQISTTKNN